MVRNSPAYPRTYFQPMLKIEQQWKPAKEGGAQVLNYNVEHNHHSPGRLELILPIMLDWETISGNFCFPKLKRTGPKKTIAHNIIPKLNFSLMFRYHHLWESARERLSQWVKEDKLQVHSMCYIILLFDIEISSIEKCCWSSSHFIRLEKSLNISNVTEMVTYI